jgi:hypothetical protein
MQLSHAFRLYLPRSRMTHWKQQHTIDVSRAHSLIIMNNHQPEWSHSGHTFVSELNADLPVGQYSPHSPNFAHGIDRCCSSHQLGSTEEAWQCQRCQ